MAKKKIAADMKDKILLEVVDKVEEYQSRMSGFFQDYNDWSDLFTIRKPRRKSNAFSNPASSVTHTAAMALAGTEYKMMTTRDPFFEFYDTSVVSRMDPESIYKATELIRTQLDKSKYRPNLFKALLQKFVFGTTIVEEPFDQVALSHLGRKLPLIKFVPRSLLQIAFDKGTTDIEDGQWVATTDLVSTYWLEGQKKNETAVGGWINSEISGAVSKDACNIEINEYIRRRLMAAGYPAEEWPENIREYISYYGKLDCVNDGVEYIVAVVNRKYVVKFAANPLQTGKRPFRVAHNIKWELEPLGYGLGKLFSALHKSINSNRQRMTDIMAFTAYNPMLRNKFAGISDKDMLLSPWKIIDTEDMEAFKPVPVNVAGVPHAITLEQLLQTEFKTASGATDTMQAMVTEATASEVTLAQNEAMRAISIKAELDAETLIKEHIEMMHHYNMLFIKDPLKISTMGDPLEIYPKDIMLDLDVKVKIVTDKDFKPERLKKMLEAFQYLSSIRNQTPEMMGVTLMPLVEEINKALEIPGRAVIGLTPQRVAEIQYATNLMNQFRVAANPGAAGQLQSGIEGDNSASGGPAVVETPVGKSLASPQ